MILRLFAPHLACTLLTCLFYFSSHDLNAQEVDSTRYLIQTIDGNVLYGFIAEKQLEYIIFQTESIGQVKIRFSDIDLIDRLADGERRPDVYRSNNSSITDTSKKRPDSYQAPLTYLVKPSGFGLKKNEAYYQSVFLFFNQVNFGISDRFSMGMGFIPLEILDESAPVWINAKYKIPVVANQVNFSLSSLNGVTLGSNQNPFGVFLGELSVGGEKNHLSVGIGQGYLNGDWRDRMALSFGGVVRITQTASLVSENYMIGDYQYHTLACYQNLYQVSLQYGLVVFNEDFGRAGFPWLGLVVPFQTKFK